MLGEPSGEISPARQPARPERGPAQMTPFGEAAGAVQKGHVSTPGNTGYWPNTCHLFAHTWPQFKLVSSLKNDAGRSRAPGEPKLGNPFRQRHTSLIVT